jgi:hypothetical protein
LWLLAYCAIHSSCVRPPIMMVPSKPDIVAHPAISSAAEYQAEARIGVTMSGLGFASA